MGIEAVLTKLNLEYETITNNIINPYYFSDEPEGAGVNTNIEDGGDDMYDSGNCLNTNLTQLYVNMDNDGSDNDTARANSIPYTHSVSGSEGNGDYTNGWNNCGWQFIFWCWKSIFYKYVSRHVCNGSNWY